MARKKTENINRVIAAFNRELSKEIPVDKIFLFGSCAFGKHDKDSDIDIIVVSSRFAKGNRIENMQYLFRKASKISTQLEPIPASPRDIATADPRAFLGQVLKTAKVCHFT